MGQQPVGAPATVHTEDLSVFNEKVSLIHDICSYLCGGRRGRLSQKHLDTPFLKSSSLFKNSGARGEGSLYREVCTRPYCRIRRPILSMAQYSISQGEKEVSAW